MRKSLLLFTIVLLLVSCESEQTRRNREEAEASLSNEMFDFDAYKPLP